MSRRRRREAEFGQELLDMFLGALAIVALAWVLSVKFTGPWARDWLGVDW